MAHRFPYATFAALLVTGPQRDRFSEFAMAARASAFRHIEFETERALAGLPPRPAPHRHRKAAMIAG